MIKRYTISFWLLPAQIFTQHAIRYFPPSLTSLSYFQACDLSEKVAELHETLATLKRESEQKIEKLRAENEEAAKAIERLQIQLKQQTELNSLKNNLMWVFYFFSSSNFLFSMRIRNPAQCPTFYGKKNNLVREMD